MNKKTIKAVLFAAVVAVVGYNVYETQLEEPMSEIALANVEALASDSEMGEGLACQTVTVDDYAEYAYCIPCCRNHIRVRVETKECDNGIFSFCYPGYVSSYYDCDGTIYRTLDNTSMSTCN